MLHTLVGVITCSVYYSRGRGPRTRRPGGRTSHDGIMPLQRVLRRRPRLGGAASNEPLSAPPNRGPGSIDTHNLTPERKPVKAFSCMRCYMSNPLIDRGGGLRSVRVKRRRKIKGRTEPNRPSQRGPHTERIAIRKDSSDSNKKKRTVGIQSYTPPQALVLLPRSATTTRQQQHFARQSLLAV